MDFQDLANLHQKLDNINDSIRSTNSNNSSSGASISFRPSTIIILVILLFSVGAISFVLMVGSALLIALFGKLVSGEIGGFVALAVVFGGFIINIVLMIIIIKKIKRMIKAKHQTQYNRNCSFETSAQTPHISNNVGENNNGNVKVDNTQKE